MKHEIDGLLDSFSYDHLPPAAREVAKPIALLAKRFVRELPSGAETYMALVALLEARDRLLSATAATTPREGATRQSYGPGWSGAL